MGFSRLTVRLGLLALMFAFLPGCGQSPPKKLIAVSGKVMYKGEPVRGATVTFVPEDAQGLDARGTTDGDGAFTLQTYPHGAGAMPGSYKVTVMIYTRSDLLPRRYTKFQLTPLAIDVQGTAMQDVVFTLEDE